MTKLFAMELMLFGLWFAIMCGLGIKIYLAHQSLKEQEKREDF